MTRVALVVFFVQIIIVGLVPAIFLPWNLAFVVSFFVELACVAIWIYAVRHTLRTRYGWAPPPRIRES